MIDPAGTYARSIRIPATNIVFRLMHDGNILLRNPNLDGGRGLTEDHVPLFRVLDTDGNFVREFGQGVFYTRPPYTTGGNRSLMAMDTGDRSTTETDLFEIQIFSADGVLLQKIPLTHYCDYLKIIDDKVYILDRDRLMQFYVYQITRTTRMDRE